MQTIRRMRRGGRTLGGVMRQTSCAGRLTRSGNFFRDRSGNVAMIFALASVPMVGLIGAAVDYSRASSDRSALQVAVDAAALAGARQLPKGKSEVKSAVDGFMKANMPLSYRGMPYEVKIDQNEKKVLVTVSVKVPTSFLKAVGTNNVEVLARSEAGTGVENSEVVLALDITGTMRNHIPSLKQGAQELVRLLFEARVGSDDLRMGIVPYVASVNIGDHPSRMDWMDIGARARYHGENFTNTLFRDKRCDPPPPPPPPTPIVTGPGPGPIAPASNNNGNGNSNPGPPKPPPPPPPPAPWSPDLGSLDKAPSGRPVFAELGTDIRAGIDFLLDALGPSKAQAGPWPYGTMDITTPVLCPERFTPPRVNHFDLFDAMNVRWKGCVEARPSPYDVTDTAPSSGNPDTLFVPYLWPDERDGNMYVRNNYLPDGGGMPDWVKDKSAELYQAWIWKYKYGGTPNVDDASFLTRGPNTACPDPIVPLTKVKAQLDNAIDRLRAYAASGTNIAEGMAWAWRVISPGDPFPEGAPYDKKNKKFVVLMTDGFNEVVPQGVDWNKSDYSAIGYAAKERLGSSDRPQITAALDNKLTTVCDNMKDKDIRVFTILYDPVGYTRSADIDRRLQNCATRPEYSFRATNSADLIASFRNIAGEIIKLRITR